MSEYERDPEQDAERETAREKIISFNLLNICFYFHSEEILHYRFYLMHQ